MNVEENNNYSGDISSEIVNVGTPITPESAMMNQNNMTNMNGMNNMDTMSYMNDNVPKKKKKWLIPVILGVIVLILLIGGVSYRMIMSSPKTVFKSSINNLYKGLNNTVDEVERFADSFDFMNKAVVFKGDIKFDTNIEEVKKLGINFGDFTLGGELGVDINNELIQTGGFLKGKSEKIDVQLYAQDDFIYGASNLLDGMIREEFSGMSEAFDEIKEYLEEYKENDSISLEDYNYVMMTVKEALIKSLDDDKMKKENDTIEILDEKVKVTKYSYTLDDKDLKKMVKSIIETLLDDKDFVKKAAKIVDEDEKSVIEYLEDAKKSCDDIEFDKKVSFNIYTSGLLNKTTGLSVEYDKTEYFHFYVNEKDFDVYCYDKVDYYDTYNESYEEKLRITGEFKNNVTEVKVIYNDKEVGLFTVREFSDKLIDFDYNLKEEGYSGTVYLSYKEEKESISGEYKIRIEHAGEFISVEGSYGIEVKDRLEKVNPSKIITQEEIDQEAVIKKLEEIVNKDEAFKKLYDNFSEYLKPTTLNEYGMIEVSSVDEINNIIKNKDKAVLYVGEPYTSYKSSSELSVINALRTVQNYYDFTSYYYSYLTLPSEFEKLTEDVKINCASKNGSDLPMNCAPDTNCLVVCPVSPTIYFIKDGKIVSGIRGDISQIEIMSGVKEIGYKLSVIFDNEKEDV